MADAIRDGNRITVALGVSNADSTVPLPFKIDSVTGRLLVSASASAMLLVATGTVDDSNLVFTFTSTPQIVVVNGMSYTTGNGVTIVTTTATLDSPAGVGGFVYGIA